MTVLIVPSLAWYVTFCCDAGILGSKTDSELAPETRAARKVNLDGPAGLVGELTPKHLELFLELAHELRVGILVDDGLVLDLLGLVRITKRRQRLFVLHVSRRDGGNHGGLGVSSQTVFEQPCQDLQRDQSI